MRQELEKLGTAKRFRFSGKFVRFGTKRGWEGAIEDTILLSDVRVIASGKQVTPHLWFNLTIGFTEAINKFLGTTWETKQEEIQRLLLEKSAVLEFDGRVENYYKGWQGQKAEDYGEARQEKDWKISRPTKVTVR